uniref:Probable membrane transporter protein n=1 Tax=Archaeoglobus fulgidus TaxID=2234 RepID=A0A7C2SQI5_ARCFL
MSLFQKLRNAYEMAMAGAYYYAKWDYETSMNIIRDRRRLATVMVLVTIPLLLYPVVAADLPSVLGGKNTYGPVHFTNEMLIVSILIGLAAGLVTGCIGAGGGFIITPALMSVGIKGIIAVGTDQFHIFAKSIMGTVVHKKLGNVCVALAIAFVIGSVTGATVGGYINREIYYMNPVLSDIFINIVYVFLLGFLGIFATYDFLRLRKMSAEFGKSSPTATDGGQQVIGMTSLARRVQSIEIPPVINFDQELGGRKVSAWFVIGCGFIVGLVSAIMGVGGGFLTFPMYVYVLGVSSFTTVGTDIFQIIITAGYSSVTQYAIYGFVFFTLSMGLLLGSLVGIQIGSLVTKVAKGMYIRGFYATVIMAGFINRLFALPSKFAYVGWIPLNKSIANIIDTAGMVLFFAVVGFFAVWVITKFVANLNVLRGDEV